MIDDMINDKYKNLRLNRGLRSSLVTENTQSIIKLIGSRNNARTYLKMNKIFYSPCAGPETSLPPGYFSFSAQSIFLLNKISLLNDINTLTVRFQDSPSFRSSGIGFFSPLGRLGTACNKVIKETSETLSRDCKGISELYF